MSTHCTRCEGSGFLNLDQVDQETRHHYNLTEDTSVITDWMDEQEEAHDVKVCDCCGDGQEWHGKPGEHYTESDPPGLVGPYASNGGLCMCN